MNNSPLQSRLSPTDHFTRFLPTGRWGRIIQFPLLRLLIALLFIAPVLALASVYRQTVVLKMSGDLQIVMKYVEAVAFFVLFLIAFRLYARIVEKRPAMELSTGNWFRECGYGFLITAGLMSLIVGVLYALGMVHVAGIHENPRIALDRAVFFSLAALIEELLFRLLLFKLLEEWLGTWAAFIIQVSLFGLLHLANDNATLWSAMCVAVEGGVILTAAYILTRRLWLAFGLHLGWNYAQSGLFSVPTSGVEIDGLIRTELHGPELLTGGNFGIEGSIIAVAFCLVVGVWLLGRARHAGQFVVARWKRLPVANLQGSLSTPGEVSFQ